MGIYPLTGRFNTMMASYHGLRVVVTARNKKLFCERPVVLWRLRGGIFVFALLPADIRLFFSCGAFCLVPGIAQMPKVNSSVKAKFPAGTLFGMGLFPDEAVAIGATTQAFLLQVCVSS